MAASPQSSSLGQFQRIFLALVAVGMATLLFFLKGGMNPAGPLEQLARRSLDPEVALANGRPTVFEFYASWCEACKEMAPTMLELEQKNEKKIDFVLLNVDNPIWEDLLDKYEVNGIPELNFFDAKGKFKGRSVGLRSREELYLLMDSLFNDTPFPSSIGIGSVSSFLNSSEANLDDSSFNEVQVGPRSHS
ncbi:thioredoxin domain-containing protein [Prochlorococcus sp. MIT 1300]|uniref:thioredoxin domain-containing protein n=1 Tax=Prochlorococcus sp. MIT 1300 TaxID=3096218 RepID=UPI002A75DD02|nr:thioredoxin domain-containing protein [Prochlorococcus sp. MIT 1300]